MEILEDDIRKLKIEGAWLSLFLFTPVVMMSFMVMVEPDFLQWWLILLGCILLSWLLQSWKEKVIGETIEKWKRDAEFNANPELHVPARSSE